MAVGRAYGMIDASAQDSSAVRATYFIDPQGVVRAINIYPHTVGRSVDEILRTLAALQRTDAGSRSEERRVGKECVSTCRSRWSPLHLKTTTKHIKNRSN